MPLHLSFTGTDDAGRLRAQRVEIRNSGAGELIWQARADAPWLLVTPARGLAPGSLSVAVDARALSPGSYAALIVIEAARADRSPQTVAVDVTIVGTQPPGPPSLRATPDRLTCSALAGDTRGATLSVHLDAEQDARVAWTARGDRPWLAVSPAQGTTPADLTVTASPSSLPVGEHAANVVIRAGGRGPALIVPVLVTVTAGRPGEALAFDTATLPQASIGVPYAQALPVRGGRAPYVFRLAGTLPPALALVKGVVTGAPKRAGAFQFSVIVTDSADPPSTVTETLELEVTAPGGVPTLLVDPARVALQAVAGSRSSLVLVNVAASGGALQWTAIADVSWLQILPGSGRSPAAFEVTADTRRMRPGTYAAEIIVTMQGAEGSPRRLPVELRIR